MKLQLAMEQQGRGAKADHLLIASILLIAGVGLVTLYSATYAFAANFFETSLHFISRQAVYTVAGLGFFFIFSRANLVLVRKWIIPVVLGTMILCVLTRVPGIGVAKNGARRWIGFGSYTVQPSELVKLVLPFYLAHIFDKKADSLDSFFVGVLPPAMVTVVFSTLIYLQNNYSTALFVLFNAFVIFFLAGIKLRYFLAAALIFVPLSIFFVLIRAHRVRRFLTFIWPEYDPQGAGYQVGNSIITISSGGFWGKGIGQGTRKISSVPEIQSDFVFSSFAEEGGFIAVLLVFMLFAVFAFTVYRSALKSKTLFGRLLGCGLGTMIVSQILLNTGVVVKAFPVTGVPLPFFSSGGSSLVTTWIMCGLLVNNSREALRV